MKVILKWVNNTCVICENVFDVIGYGFQENQLDP
jgi:hypothetical protein